MKEYITCKEISLPEYEGFLQEESFAEDNDRND